MLIRIFQGNNWSEAQAVGDFAFDALPVAGHKIAVAGEAGWTSGQVRDVVHRVGDPANAADVAVLVGPMLQGTERAGMLPTGQLDRLNGAPVAAASVPRSGPWG